MLEQHGSSRSTRSSRLARQNDWLDKVERVESSQVEFGLMTVFWRGIFREEFPRPHRWLLHLPTRCSGTCCWKCVHSSAIQCGFWFSHILVSSADWDYRTSIVVNFDLCSAWCWSILAVFFKIKKITILLTFVALLYHRRRFSAKLGWVRHSPSLPSPTFPPLFPFPSSKTS